MSELLLIAATGLAREVLATVRSSGRYDVVGFLDDDAMAGTDVDGAPVLGLSTTPPSTRTPFFWSAWIPAVPARL